MERPSRAPQGIDLSVPSVYRSHDRRRGGPQRCDAERGPARQAATAVSGQPETARSHRALRHRAAGRNDPALSRGHAGVGSRV